MKILVLLLGVIFSSLYYILDQIQGVESSIFSTITIWLGVCLLLSIGTIIFLYRIDSKGAINTSGKKFVKLELSPSDIYQIFKDFFRKYSYSLALIFFYLGVFFIGGYMYDGIVIEYIFFISSLIVCIIALGASKSTFIRNLLKINISVIGLYYIFISITNIVFDMSMGGIDYGNIFLVVLSIGIYNFISSTTQTYKSIQYEIFTLIFFLSLISLGVDSYIGKSLGIYILLGTGICLGSFLFTELLSKLLGYKKISFRTIGVLCGSITVIGANFYDYSFDITSILILFSLGALGYLSIKFHTIFENYIALSTGIGAFVLLFYTILYLLFQGAYSEVYLLIFSYISLGILFFISKKYSFTVFITSLISILLVHSIGIIIFLSSYWNNILGLGIFFMVESLFFITMYTLYHSRVRYLGINKS